MEKVLIKINNHKELNNVFDFLKIKGEKTSENHFGYTDGVGDWNFVGFYKLYKYWTLAKKSSQHFDYIKIITYDEFMNNNQNYEIY